MKLARRPRYPILNLLQIALAGKTARELPSALGQMLIAACLGCRDKR